MQGKHITAIVLSLVLCSAGIIYAIVQKPAPEPKPERPRAEELYVRCVEAGGVTCQELFDEAERLRTVRMKKREQLEKAYTEHLAKCLAWKADKNKKHGDFDGTNGCSLSASIHMQKLGRQ